MSATSDPVALEYELTASELASFYGEALARSRLDRWLWPQRRFLLGLIFLAVVLIASMLFSSSAWWDHANTRLLVSAAFGLFILVLAVFDPLFSALLIRRRARRGKYAPYLRRMKLEVTSTALKATIAQSGETREWPAIYDIKLSRIGALIQVAPAHAFMIPKRPFASEAEFMAFLTKVSELPRQKRALP